MKYIIFTKSGSDTITVRMPAYNDTSRTTETDDELLARSIARLPDGTDYHIVDAEDLPTDRYFRNAWEWND